MMKAAIFAAATAALIAGSALAAQTTGTIRSISKARDTITLTNGERFHLPEGIEVESLSVGEHVKISYATGKGNGRQVSNLRQVQ
jgi:hypothetical protein